MRGPPEVCGKESVSRKTRSVPVWIYIYISTSRDRERPSLSERGFQVWSYQRSGYVLSNEEKQRGRKGENG